MKTGKNSHKITVIQYRKGTHDQLFEEIFIAGKRQTVTEKARFFVENDLLLLADDILTHSPIIHHLGNSSQTWRINDPNPEPAKKDDSTPRQQNRRDRLNTAAIAAGFPSWSAYETAVLNDKVSITTTTA